MPGQICTPIDTWERKSPPLLRSGEPVAVVGDKKRPPGWRARRGNDKTFDLVASRARGGFIGPADRH